MSAASPTFPQRAGRRAPARAALGGPLRRGWDDLAPGTPQREAPPGATAWVSLVLLSVMLGGFGAFFAGSLRAELITFVAVAGPFAAWLWWARRRALRRTSPGSATAT